MELSPDVQPLSLPLAHVIIDNKLKSDRQGKPVMIILFIFTLLMTVGAALNDMLPAAAGSAVVMVLFFCCSCCFVFGVGCIDCDSCCVVVTAGLGPILSF